MTVENGASAPSHSQARALIAKNLPQAYWPGVFPLCGPNCVKHSKQFPICPSPGKTPNRQGYTMTAVRQYRAAELGELNLPEIGEQIVEWIVSGQNIGLVPPPNVVVVDADDAAGVKWVREHRPEGAAVQSRSKTSEHSWMSFDPEEWAARNKTYKLDIGGKERAKVDLRCPGKGYVVIPPSVHKDGLPYKWTSKLPDSIADIPQIPETIKEPFRPHLLDKVKAREDRQSEAGHDVILRYINRLCRYESGTDPVKALAHIRERALSFVNECYANRVDRAKEMTRTGGEMDRLIESGWDMFGALAPLDEDGSDEAIVSLICAGGDQIYHIEAYGKYGWRIWDGVRWAPMSVGEVKRGIGEFNQNLFEDSLRESDSERRGRLMSMSKKLRMQKNVMSAFARLTDRVRIDAEEFDSNPWLLTFPGDESRGIPAWTLDLKTGEARAPAPEDMISKVMGAAYDPDAESEDFERYIETSMPDLELRDYVQRALGASLLGHSLEDAFYFLHGFGSSGKGALLSSACMAFGDYGQMAQPATFSGDGPVDGGKAEPDLLAMKGKRFVFVDEISDIRKIGARMKNLTGGSAITARGLYGDLVTFAPQHSVWLAGNQQPKAASEDSGLWRRAKEIPMNAGGALKDGKAIDKGLRRRMQTPIGLTALVRWMVEGLEDVRDAGWEIGDCEAVTNATNAFRDSSDPIGEWFSECLELDDSGETSITRSEMFSHYENWMDDQFGPGSRREVPRANPRSMSSALRRRGLGEKMIRGVRIWTGARFLTPESAPSATKKGLSAPRRLH